MRHQWVRGRDGGKGKKISGRWKESKGGGTEFYQMVDGWNSAADVGHLKRKLNHAIPPVIKSEK